ncbi:MAG: DUF6110 family protein [Coriobacteriales bacterium]|jgi:hypothetical protein|nr:DUF6110 family protein [Coriobacteriales bacterium]
MAAFEKKSALLVLGGFLAGTLGIKVLTSKPAKKLYVGAIAQGLKAKANAEEVYEEGKAQFEDILAEAEYLNSAEKTDAAEAGEEA